MLISSGVWFCSFEAPRLNMASNDCWIVVIEFARRDNPRAQVCCYGLYAPVNAGYLRSLGVGTVLGGEFEGKLRALAQRLAAGDCRDSAELQISLERLRFEIPDRSGLPPLTRYARMLDGDTSRITGYTEASRGCKHLCRHCPIVPVYNGTFRVIPAEIVMADIRQQVEAGTPFISARSLCWYYGSGWET